MTDAINENMTQQLVGLLDYTKHMASLGERPIFRLVDYRGLVFHEKDLRNRVGIHHDLVEEDETTWLKIDRLVRVDPPRTVGD